MIAGIDAFFNERGIAFVESGGSYSFTVPAERKHSIGVALAPHAGGVRIESFFMRAPMQDAADVYRLLLSRNAGSRLIWFAIDALGDVYLLGFIAREAFNLQTLDELLGEIVTTTDAMFDAVMQTGFRDYLEQDLRWREKHA